MAGVEGQVVWKAGERTKVFFLGQVQEYYTSDEKSKEMVMDIDEFRHETTLEEERRQRQQILNHFFRSTLRYTSIVRYQSPLFKGWLE